MILSCYIFDLRRHLLVLRFFPGCSPYELHATTNWIIFSRSKFRRLVYQGSLLGSLVTFLVMSYFLFAKNHDIFLTLFGLMIQTVFFITLLIRWNFSCSSKFIDVFNQFLVFESNMRLKPAKNQNTGKNKKAAISLGNFLFD